MEKSEISRCQGVFTAGAQVLILFLLLMCIVLSPALAEAQIYVSPTGLDRSDCGPATNPCRTIQAAVSKLTWPPITIILGPGVYSEEVTIGRQSLQLIGAGEGETVLDGAGRLRLLHITQGVTVTVSGLTIRNGLGRASENSAGGIRNEGSLTLNNVTLSNNRGVSGGAISNFGTLVLNEVTLSQNRAGADGGAISSSRGSMLLMDKCTLRANNAAEGGGIWNGGGAMLIVNTLFADNLAQTSGGGMGIAENGFGTMANVTFSGNGAVTGDGGGLYVSGGASVSVENLTFSENFAGGNGGGVFAAGGTFRLANTLFSGNTPTNCGGDLRNYLSSSGHNLSSDASCASALTAAGDLNNIDPRLGPLTEVGGPTAVRPLPAGSPAIDAGNNATCATPIDQVGTRRPQDGDGDGNAVCDIGAYEHAALSAPGAAPGAQSGLWAYTAMAGPESSSDPAACKPFSIGPLAGNILGPLNLQIGLPRFSRPVDLYVGIFLQEISVASGFLVTSSGIRPLAEGIFPWKTNVTGPVYESLFGEIPVAGLPRGKYHLVLLAAPVGRLDPSYLWTTDFTLFTLTAFDLELSPILRLRPVGPVIPFNPQ